MVIEDKLFDFSSLDLENNIVINFDRDIDFKYLASFSNIKFKYNLLVGDIKLKKQFYINGVMSSGNDFNLSNVILFRFLSDSQLIKNYSNEIFNNLNGSGMFITYTRIFDLFYPLELKLKEYIRNK